MLDRAVIPLLVSPREEGWLRGQSKVAKPPYSAQTGAQRERDSAKHKEWSLTSRVSERIPKPEL